ncbi:MAG TPA: hypothetical protein VMB18_02885 [Terriglobales bacterium]|nr:hypothetical protein [Terriglobales bacterium]
MPRWLLLAALGAALMATPLWAQRGGGGHGGGFGGGHASFGGHAGFSSPAMGGFRGSSMAHGFSGGHWGGGWGNGFRRPYPRGGSCWGGRCFYGRGYGYWPYAYAGWGWGYPWYYDDNSYDNYADDYQSQPPPDYGYAPPADYQSQAEIDRLHEEVAQLRDQMHNVPRPPAPKETAPEPTQLVFADQHTEQVENYAIVRQNLWIFDGSRTRKIPLASLDIPATEKANQDRGVDFEIPN